MTGIDIGLALGSIVTVWMAGFGAGRAVAWIREIRNVA